MNQEKLGAEEVAKKAMLIASDICIYTNSNFTIEKL
jgi:ATP-dependent HslUV protease subunit HslV